MFKRKIGKLAKMLVTFLKYIPDTSSIVCSMFLMYATIQHINYKRQESKRQCALYDSDTSVTLKQGQGHPTWFDLVDSNQGYSHAKFNDHA